MMQLIKRVLRPGIGQLGTYKAKPLVMNWGLTDERYQLQSFPVISIVIPSLNQGRFIESTIKSIIRQNYPVLELIIIDGGSHDNTLEIIKKYEKHIYYWVSEKDAGQAHAINKGFLRSTGEVMAWINSDDLLAPGALSLIAQYFSKFNEVDVIYGDRVLIDENGHEIGRWMLPWHSSKVLKWADFVPQETLYWRRHAWSTVGSSVDEKFNFAMDWDILLRFSKANLNIRHLPFFLGIFRVHTYQKTSILLDSIGKKEIAFIRHQELGFYPSTFQIKINIAIFLLASRLREIIAFFSYRISPAKTFPWDK